jgi:hypothetical protein
VIGFPNQASTCSRRLPHEPIGQQTAVNHVCAGSYAGTFSIRAAVKSSANGGRLTV